MPPRFCRQRGENEEHILEICDDVNNEAGRQKIKAGCYLYFLPSTNRLLRGQQRGAAPGQRTGDFLRRQRLRPWRFTGLKRGACATQPAAHAPGPKARHLKEMLGLFVPNPESSLFEEIAANHAAVVNQCGFDGLYLPVDFTGRRRCMLVETESSRWSDFVWDDAKSAYNVYRETIDFGAVESASVWLQHLPPGHETRCAIRSLRLLPLQSVVVKNPIPVCSRACSAGLHARRVRGASRPVLLCARD